MSQRDQRVLEELRQLQALTVRTGIIHEAQALQLRNWPLLIPGVKSAEAIVDAERKMVTYSCKTETEKTFRRTKVAAMYIEQIGNWTRNIVWPDSTVVVKVNGKVIDV